MTDIDVDLDGGLEARLWLAGIAHRLRDADEIEDALTPVLEKGYRRRWVDWRGFLVDTGRLRSSFTQSGIEAIREAHGMTFVFGSRTPYAQFHARHLLRWNPRVEEDLAAALADAYVEDEAPHPLAAHF